MSDTPRTDAKSVDHIGFYSCATVTSDFARQLERELAVSLENQCKAQAEVARLNNTLENTRISRATIIEDRNLLDQELAASKAEVAALSAMAIELVKELIAKCDDPIHREQLSSLTKTNSLQPSV